MIVIWDSLFNASPGSSLPKSLIDDQLRRTRVAIRERMEVEHQFGYNTDYDTGEHIPGGTTVMGKGDAAAMAAVSNPYTGALYLQDDGSDYQVYYYDAGWNQISSLDHLNLTGVDDNDHPTLLLKDGGVLIADLDMGGYVINTSEATADTFGGFLLYRHKENAHAAIGNVSAIADDSIGVDELNIQQVEDTFTVPAGTVYTHYTYGSIAFVPQIYAKTTWTDEIFLGGGIGSDGWSISNTSASSVDVRYRGEYI